MTYRTHDDSASRARRTKLARLLFERDMTAAQLGRRLDPPITRFTVSNWVRGRQPIPEFRAAQIAELFKLHAEDVVGFEDEDDQAKGGAA